MKMKDDLLRLLKRGRWVTPQDALSECGCMSLSQRIGNFISVGYGIDKKWVKCGRSRFRAYRYLHAPKV